MEAGQLIPPGIWTLADVLQNGRDKGVCPYFTVRRMVRRLVDTAFSGSPEDLVLALVEDEALSGAEIERIRAIIDRAERSGE